MGPVNADVKNEDVKFVGPALLREEGGGSPKHGKTGGLFLAGPG